MGDVDPRAASSWAPRASVGLTALAVALLTCGAAIEVTGNVLDSAAKGYGGDSHPVRTVPPTHGRSRTSQAPSPSPHHSPSSSPTDLPGSSPSTSPTASPSPSFGFSVTPTATGDSFTRQ
ncbi:hypothetical protein ACGFZS_31810 [Streptomyces sp. NPDC048288]|uniref:hypothetical protein n=1 Tax=Streptomyces sp. NPDC048288 TaxID=3365529 RepID=UPI003718936A